MYNMSEMEQKKDSPPLDLLQFYCRSHYTLPRGRWRILKYQNNGKVSNNPSFGVVSARGWGGGGGLKNSYCDLFRMKDFWQGDFFGRINPFIHTFTLVSTSLQWPLSSVPKVALALVYLHYRNISVNYYNTIALVKISPIVTPILKLTKN